MADRCFFLYLLLLILIHSASLGLLFAALPQQSTIIAPRLRPPQRIHLLPKGRQLSVINLVQCFPSISLRFQNDLIKVFGLAHYTIIARVALEKVFHDGLHFSLPIGFHLQNGDVEQTTECFSF